MPEVPAPDISPTKKLYECSNCLIKLFTDKAPVCDQCGNKMRWKKRIQLG